jgi:acetyl esterase/lipase
MLTCRHIGGGYAQPMTPGHLTFLNDLLTLVNSTSTSSTPNLSVVLLAYTLAPQAQHPTQLTQAASLLTHVLQSKSASDLILAGDSAGGNLLLGVLSHLLHPHSQVPTIDLRGESLRAALLISPWVSFDTSHPSYTRNAESDVFDHVPLEMWSRAFLGSSQRQGILMGDSYSEPLVAEPTWWSGAHKVVGEVLIWGGGGELFIDGIKAFGEKFREGWVAGGGISSKVSVVERERLCHEAMIMDAILGYKEKGPGAKDVENFVRSKL